MNYTEAIRFLFSRLPMFQRTGPPAYKPGLENIQKLLALIGNPHITLPCVHVAGTNGKGSTSHMLASVCMEAGYKTGLFTSPHLLDFRERIKINGKPIPKRTVSEFVEKWKNGVTDIQPSFFEWTTALAFYWFREMKTDINIIETGMGGRLDSTNAIMPEISVITNISFDHTQFLGDTLEKIASEKAGIIKKEVPVVISYYQKEVAQVFINKAKEMHAPIHFANRSFNVRKKKECSDGQVFEVQYGKTKKTLTCGLKGNYQEKNLPGVLMAIKVLNEKGRFRFSEAALKRGIRNVVVNTGLRGRWEQVMKNPTVILDTGHNEDGILSVIKQSKEMKKKNVFWIFGLVKDKDAEKIISLLPGKWKYLIVKPEVERGRDAKELNEIFKEKGFYSFAFRSIRAAWKHALRKAGKQDLILVGGSTFVVADFLKKKLEKNYKVRNPKLA